MSVLLPGNRRNGHGKAAGEVACERRIVLATADTAHPASEKRQARIAAWRVAIAFAVAATADILFVVVSPFEPLEIFCDALVALMLCGILGFNWVLVPALLAEAVPGLDVFPSWTVAVMAIAGVKAMKQK